MSPTEGRRGPPLLVRLLLAQLIVIGVGLVTLLVGVGLVAPRAFEDAMGHSMGGMMGGSMDAVMSDTTRTAFNDAVRVALLVAGGAALVAALIVSILVSRWLAEPIARLASASRRIAHGHYAERVPADAGGEIGELAGSFNEMAAALEATELRRVELVGDVAHELRTPLTTLDGYLEGLQDGVVPASPATWALLRGETGRLSRLVEDLQQLWRAEAGQVELAPDTVDATALASEVADRFGPSARERCIDLRIVAPERPVSVRADRARLAQVLDNLVSNAIRYSPTGSQLVVDLRAQGQTVVFSVVDQGPGLAPEQLTRVFERFYRADPSRSRALGGSGIGLSIARALVQAMGGRIWAESPGPGLGATFRIELPGAP